MCQLLERFIISAERLIQRLETLLIWNVLRAGMESFSLAPDILQTNFGPVFSRPHTVEADDEYEVYKVRIPAWGATFPQATKKLLDVSNGSA